MAGTDRFAAKPVACADALQEAGGLPCACQIAAEQIACAKHGVTMLFHELKEAKLPRVPRRS